MQDKSKFDELLISYLSKELDPEDEALVVGWINFDQQNKQYFEQLKTVWRLLEVKRANDNINPDYEWHQFKQAINDKHENTRTIKDVVSIEDEITEEENSKKKVTVRIVISTAIAASVLLIAAFAAGLFEDNMAGKHSKAIVSKEKRGSVTAYVKLERNTSGKPKRLTLKDGSEIILSDKSEVSYPEPFAGNRREITLKGKAYFKVTKDRTKPFTVKSGDLSTTVLGTRFTVTAFENAKNITVRLYEGKVVVKPATELKKKVIHNYYLLPGQELIYNNLSSLAKLRNFKVENAKAPATNSNDIIAQQRDIPSVPSNEKGTWYMFNNQSLNDVFKQLENMYDVQIVYSKRDVSHKYFIGKFEKSDSVENILKQIATLNNLKVIKNNNKFIISK